MKFKTLGLVMLAGAFSGALLARQLKKSSPVVEPSNESSYDHAFNRAKEGETFNVLNKKKDSIYVYEKRCGMGMFINIRKVIS